MLGEREGVSGKGIVNASNGSVCDCNCGASNSTERRICEVAPATGAERAERRQYKGSPVRRIGHPFDSYRGTDAQGSGAQVSKSLSQSKTFDVDG